MGSVGRGPTAGRGHPHCPSRMGRDGSEPQGWLRAPGRAQHLPCRAALVFGGVLVLLCLSCPPPTPPWDRGGHRWGGRRGCPAPGPRVPGQSRLSPLARPGAGPKGNTGTGRDGAGAREVPKFKHQKDQKGKKKKKENNQIHGGKGPWDPSGLFPGGAWPRGDAGRAGLELEWSSGHSGRERRLSLR